jgi:hypothetical protein
MFTKNYILVRQARRIEELFLAATSSVFTMEHKIVRYTVLLAFSC